MNVIYNVVVAVNWSPTVVESVKRQTGSAIIMSVRSSSLLKARMCFISTGLGRNTCLVFVKGLLISHTLNPFSVILGFVEPVRMLDKNV